MWKDISELIGANPILTLMITILGTSTIWLYKEFKVMMERSSKQKIETLNNKIKMYSQLEANIAAVVHYTDNTPFKNNLIEKFGEYSIQMSEDTRRIAIDYIQSGDALYLKTLASFIQYELTKLHKARTKVLQNEEPVGIDGFVSKLFAPFKPIAFIWFIIIVSLASYEMYSVQQIWYDRLNVLIIIFPSVILSVGTLIAILSLLFDNEVRLQGKYGWALIILLAPLIVFISKYLSVISLIVQAAGLYKINKMKKRKPGLITLD